MHAFAQTDLQLINQLRNSGYPPPELTFIMTAYELAMRLFTGRFRASGKTFIAHLVGTASIPGPLRTPSTVVAAGLTHAAYTAGDFGDSDTGMTNARRESVRALLGTESEKYVARYSRLRWGKETIRTIHDGLESRDPLDRAGLLVRCQRARGIPGRGSAIRQRQETRDSEFHRSSRPFDDRDDREVGLSPIGRRFCRGIRTDGRRLHSCYPE